MYNFLYEAFGFLFVCLIWLVFLCWGLFVCFCLVEVFFNLHCASALSSCWIGCVFRQTPYSFFSSNK